MSVQLPNDPARDDVLAGRPALWLNPNLKANGIADQSLPIRAAQVKEAEENWQLLAPVLETCFPELKASKGRIQSKLIEAEDLRGALGYGTSEYGRVFVKADGDLPVAGSIKARGGVYEVFMHAKKMAEKRGILTPGGDITVLVGEQARALFAQHTIAVGSTGNLGLSVGIAARALGFRAVVHMSSDAKQWKVDRLTRLGVEVVQHKADYTTAVEHARIDAEGDPSIYFVDDERSEMLFFGYSAAASELAVQLKEQGVTIDEDHPLFIYLPCGIGGAPGGAAYGLKAIFGDAAHAFFVEPVQSPCAMVHMMSGSKELISVYDVGLTNRTEADGMAVARMSEFVADVMKPMLSGVFTVDDDDLFRWLWKAQTTQAIRLEPSATAGFAGPEFIVNSNQGRAYQEAHGLSNKLAQATHVIWTTGGAFVPEEQFKEFMARGALLVK
ncbi:MULTISPECIES: D-serine ammonia-lyase [Pseudomonas]|jgi:D-serine dehydratase|uniref:D-serine ammonia-lyase n=2 Tax=Pseudomonas TaxID=286 RepID=UPI0001FB96EB|nr:MULTISPECIES: D-serine ammonia-lyase [Pseudomonas]MDQ3595083.1 D-serine ammonia-lyase [Pseudomonadota bacterium]NPA19900.1 D-serine ammonia-lyase [Gammaproteobacteria bacterium]QPN48227.1 D-serine ammonia-lyase [Priestia aryabhattai]WHL30283.1 D-serine ammonia-lyase [Pseudomonas juntendi]EGB98333.1 serine dehydratase [Pseudomonas sp. TJI-51]|eukprot:gene11387-13273_t